MAIIVLSEPKVHGRNARTIRVRGLYRSLPKDLRAMHASIDRSIIRLFSGWVRSIHSQIPAKQFGKRSSESSSIVPSDLILPV